MSEDLRLTGLVGFSGMKVPVDVCATSNITLTGEQTIDGVLTADSRVLLTGQTDQKENGIWVSDSGAWSRASDCDGPYDLRTGSCVFVTAGTSNSGFWYCTTANTVDIGTDNITWARASTVLAAINAFWQSMLGTSTATAAFSALAAEAITASGVISPTTLAANTDDWAPTSFSTSSMIRVSASAAYNLTGIAGGAAGRIILLHNVGSFTITLKNDTTSTAANRFLFAADYALGANQSVLLEYDGTSSRWRMVGDPGVLSSSKLVSSVMSGSVGMINGTIVTSRAASAETIAIKTIAGADPSAADPVYLIFRNVTAATGDYSVLTITAALSITIPSTATMGASNNVPFRIWLVVFNDGGTARLGVVNCLSGTNIMALRDDIISSSTLTPASAAQTIYTTGAAATNKAIRLLGYLEYTLATAGTWNTAPSKVQLFGPGVTLPGQVVQAKRATYNTGASGATAIPYDSTVPTASEGNAIASLDISLTATSGANVISRRALVHTTRGAGANICAAFLHKDSGGADAIAIYDSFNGDANIPASKFVEYEALAGDASAHTYSVRYGSDAGTVYLNQNSGATQIFGAAFASWQKVEEIMA